MKDKEGFLYLHRGILFICAVLAVLLLVAVLSAGGVEGLREGYEGLREKYSTEYTAVATVTDKQVVTLMRYTSYRIYAVDSEGNGYVFEPCDEGVYAAVVVGETYTLHYRYTAVSEYPVLYAGESVGTEAVGEAATE